MTLRLRTEPGVSVEATLAGERHLLTQAVDAGGTEVGEAWYEATVRAPEDPGSHTVVFGAVDVAGYRVQAERTLTVRAAAIRSPQGLVARVEGKDVVLSWQPVGGAIGYEIYFGVAVPGSSDLSALDRSLTIDVPVTEAKITSLQEGLSYAFAVTARSADGSESPRSVMASVQIPSSIAGGTVQAQPQAHGVEIRWLRDGLMGTPNSARVEYGISDGVYTEVRSYPFDPLFATVGDLIDGLPYFFSLSFLDAQGGPLSPPQRFHAVPGVPGAQGFHPVASEPVRLPPPQLGRLSLPLGFLGRDVTALQRPPAGAPRPPMTAPTGSLSLAVLSLLLTSVGGCVVVGRMLAQRRRDRAFLLAMAASYTSPTSLPS